ncbi:hypothetical protein [Sorangium cellulosum]|uniref:hypothetical protein n=1 Tax=Sorangium TaxID=39643 RepID=UPI0018F76BC1|nr:hypothetical protein [Sorangium cellulosum]
MAEQRLDRLDVGGRLERVGPDAPPRHGVEPGVQLAAFSSGEQGRPFGRRPAAPPDGERQDVSPHGTTF